MTNVFTASTAPNAEGSRPARVMVMGSATWNCQNASAKAMTRTRKATKTRSRSTAERPTKCAKPPPALVAWNSSAGLVSGMRASTTHAKISVVAASRQKGSAHPFRASIPPATSETPVPTLLAQYTSPKARARDSSGTTSASIAMIAGFVPCEETPKAKTTAAMATGDVKSARIAAQAAEVKSPMRMVGRRPIRSASAPPSGPATIIPPAKNEATKPVVDGDIPRAVRKSARKGNTKVASAERSAPDQSHQKRLGSPPTCAARKLPGRLDIPRI